MRLHSLGLPILIVSALVSWGCSSSDSAPGGAAGSGGTSVTDGGGGSDASAQPDSVAEAATDVSSECVPKSCLQLGASCGSVDDGCGVALDCGTCTEPDTCGGAGVENQCGCSARSCAQLGVNCGEVDTGCGLVVCGGCVEPDTCGGGGVVNQCGCSCSLPHAQTSCSGGICRIEACDDGWASCDGDDANGCETEVAIDLENCGACGHTCSFANVVDAKCEDGSCVMGDCTAGFADCDGAEDTGCEANLQVDPNNCDFCGNACPPAGGTPACVAGQCTVSTCAPGLGDCNVMIPGCETDLVTSSQHCGYCGNTCSFPRADAKCELGKCEIAQCVADFGNCDGNETNGCETNIGTSIVNCGACESACLDLVNTTTTCVGGSCKYVCNVPWLDCDENLGCETNAATNVNNCGACEATCSSNHVVSVSCMNGACAGTCLTGFTDCNNDMRSDACETNTAADLQNCGICGRVCSANHISQVRCTSGVCNGPCAASWADCNHDKATDGCETNLKSDHENCGACGAACGDCQACTNGACIGIPCE